MGHDMISVPFGIFTARLPSIQNLTVWAYPKSANFFEDALVCCVQHNPNPVVFKMNCEGVEPKLEVDTKLLDFKKVLLHR